MSVNTSNNISGGSALGGSTASSSSSSKNIGDQFTALLVAQLKNQDPLNPTDPAAITTQLAQLNSLQQLENINKQLTALAGAGNGVGATLSQAATAVGKTVQLGLGAAGEPAFSTKNGSIHYDFGGDVTYNSVLSVTDVNGSLLASFRLEGSAGDVAVGNLPEGSTVRVDSTLSNGRVDAVHSGYAMLGQNMHVKSVALSAGNTYLVDASGERAAWSSVVGLN